MVVYDDKILEELIVEKRNIGYHPDANSEYENSDYIKIPVEEFEEEIKYVFHENLIP